MKHIGFDLTDEEWSTFAPAFIREMPIPQEPIFVDGEVQMDGDKPVMVDTHTDEKWMMLCAIKYIAKKSERGAAKLRLDADPIQSELVNDIIDRNI